MIAYRVTTPPALQPVSTAEAKAEMIVEHSRHDSYISSLIDRAVDYIERYLERPIMEQVIEFEIRETGKGATQVPTPVISIDAIKGVDINSETLAETETALTVGNFTLWKNQEPWLLLGDFDTIYDYFKVTATVGYESADDVPEGIKELILLLVSARYTDRLDFGKVDIKQLAVNHRHKTFAC